MKALMPATKAVAICFASGPYERHSAAISPRYRKRREARGRGVGAQSGPQRVGRGGWGDPRTRRPSRRPPGAEKVVSWGGEGAGDDARRCLGESAFIVRPCRTAIRAARQRPQETAGVG